jgi:hypothetical protein
MKQEGGGGNVNRRTTAAVIVLPKGRFGTCHIRGSRAHLLVWQQPAVLLSPTIRQNAASESHVATTAAFHIPTKSLYSY